MKAFSKVAKGDSLVIVTGFNHPFEKKFFLTGVVEGDVIRRSKKTIYVKPNGRRNEIALDKSAYEENYKRVMSV